MLGPHSGSELSADFSFIHPDSPRGLLGQQRRRLDPHRLRARALLEEVAVRPLAVVPAAIRALAAERWLWGYGCGSSLVAERQEWS